MSKSDIFAIGMIILEVCTLQPSSECYDEESYNIVDSGKRLIYHKLLRKDLLKLLKSTLLSWLNALT
jgi:hypothetical protein